MTTFQTDSWCSFKAHFNPSLVFIFELPFAPLTTSLNGPFPSKAILKVSNSFPISLLLDFLSPNFLSLHFQMPLLKFLFPSLILLSSLPNIYKWMRKVGRNFSLVSQGLILQVARLNAFQVRASVFESWIWRMLRCWKNSILKVMKRGFFGVKNVA